MPLLFIAAAGPQVLGPALPTAPALGIAAITLADLTAADWSLMLDVTATQSGLASGVGAIDAPLQKKPRTGRVTSLPSCNCDRWREYVGRLLIWAFYPESGWLTAHEFPFHRE